MEYVSYFPSPVTKSLLVAVQPLLGLNESLTDHLIVVLKKALLGRYYHRSTLILSYLYYRREVNSRATSVTGFIQLLKFAKGNPHTPQKNKGKSTRAILHDSACFDILGKFHFIKARNF